MQREIKFRAWNAYAKAMYDVDVLHISNRNWKMPEFNQGDAQYMSLVYQPKVILMQYTGCIDKNGKEIYEGDIVRDDTTNSIWAVTWNAEAAGWTDKQDNPYSYGLYKSLEKSMEVIGNIYENPEILEEA